MNPILFYPQNASQVKMFGEIASTNGFEYVSIPKNILEEIDDFFYGRELAKIHKKSKPISYEKLQDLFDKKLGRK
jgi:hypothetical protein